MNYPEPPDEPTTKKGDLWILGSHRLLCGDAGKAEDVDRLLDGSPIRPKSDCLPAGQRQLQENPSWAGHNTSKAGIAGVHDAGAVSGMPKGWVDLRRTTQGRCRVRAYQMHIRQVDEVLAEMKTPIQYLWRYMGLVVCGIGCLRRAYRFRFIAFQRTRCRRQSERAAIGNR
jgi:hypothetical protein